MLKNIINLILGLFGSSKKESTAQNEWSSGDYDRYANLKKEKSDGYLAQKDAKNNGDKV